MECFITCLLRLLILNNIFKVRLRSQSDRFIQSEKDFGRLHTPNLLLKGGSMFKTDQAALGLVQPGLENLLKAIWDICDMNTNSPCCVNSLDISFRIDSEKRLPWSYFSKEVPQEFSRAYHCSRNAMTLFQSRKCE